MNPADIEVENRLSYRGDVRGNTVHVRAQTHLAGAGVQIPLERNGLPVFVNKDGYPVCVLNITYDEHADRTLVELAIATPAVREALAS